MRGDLFSDIDFSDHLRVIAAVSGGSDSTGLLVLLHEHLSKLPSAPVCIAVTVDHGLRPESAQEAKVVAALCARIGIEHRTKRWEAQKPATGIQAAAREARYDLLMEAAHEVGAGLVLTGHTDDDQIETVFMRAARGEGPGLAGIAPATLSFFRDRGGPPVWFARPLLQTSRAAIRAEMARRGIEWSDDPSNKNLEYERARTRQGLANLPDEALAGLRQSQALWAAKRFDLSQRAGAVIDAHFSEASPGLFLFAPALADEPDKEAAAEALRTCLAFAGGVREMIEKKAALDILDCVASGKPFRRTGSRALLDSRKQGLFLLREKRNVRRDDGDFDGRYGYPLNALQAAGQAAVSGNLPPSLVRHAMALEPSADGADSNALTRAGFRRILNPWPVRVPLFDLPAAAALARVAAIPAFPPAPCSL